VLDRLLPRRADNAFRGHRLALWLLGVTLFMKSAIGVNSIVNGRSVAQGADGVPLDTFPPAAAQTVVSLFGLLGVSQLVICLLGVVVLTRYRSLVPFLFALLLVEHLSRRGVAAITPVARSGNPPGTLVIFALLALMVVGLALSLQRGRNVPPED
jgi:hypothetical protein